HGFDSGALLSRVPNPLASGRIGRRSCEVASRRSGIRSRCRRTRSRDAFRALHESGKRDRPVHGLGGLEVKSRKPATHRLVPVGDVFRLTGLTTKEILLTAILNGSSGSTR